MEQQSKPKLWIFWIATGLIVVSQFASGVMDWMAAEPLVEDPIVVTFDDCLNASLFHLLSRIEIVIDVVVVPW